MSHVGYGVGANALQLLNFMCVLYCLFTFLICCDAYIYATFHTVVLTAELDAHLLNFDVHCIKVWCECNID